MVSSPHDEHIDTNKNKDSPLTESDYVSVGAEDEVVPENLDTALSFGGGDNNIDHNAVQLDTDVQDTSKDGENEEVDESGQDMVPPVEMEVFNNTSDSTPNEDESIQGGIMTEDVATTLDVIANSEDVKDENTQGEYPSLAMSGTQMPTVDGEVIGDSGILIIPNSEDNVDEDHPAEFMERNNSEGKDDDDAAPNALAVLADSGATVEMSYNAQTTGIFIVPTVYEASQGTPVQPCENTEEFLANTMSSVPEETEHLNVQDIVSDSVVLNLEVNDNDELVLTANEDDIGELNLEALDTDGDGHHLEEIASAPSSPSSSSSGRSLKSSDRALIREMLREFKEFRADNAALKEEFQQIRNEQKSLKALIAAKDKQIIRLTRLARENQTLFHWEDALVVGGQAVVLLGTFAGLWYVCRLPASTVPGMTAFYNDIKMDKSFAKNVTFAAGASIAAALDCIKRKHSSAPCAGM